MVVVLKPVSAEGIADVRIDGGLLAVGQNEAPFSSYEPHLVESLSKRHARIFQENNALFVVDLGSEGGTTLNGEAVPRTPVVMNPGDVIAFSDKLSYKVEFPAESASEAPQQSAQAPRLLLVPEREDRGLESLAVERFPFLVSNSGGLFSRYRKSLPREINYISRRHAHIFLQDGEIYVEDLGSTNGTFVAGVRLGERAEKLRDGVTLSFGQSVFSYKVEIQNTQPNEQQTVFEAGARARAADKPPVLEGTTFVSTASSFLDIYCTSSDDSRDKQSTVVQQKPSDNSGLHYGDWHRKLTQSPVGQTVSRLLAQRETRFAVTVVVGVLLLAGSAFWFFADDRREDIERALAAGAYGESLALAGDYLAENPDDAGVSELAIDALLKHVMPGWLQALNNNQFADVEQILSEAGNLAAQQKSKELIALLGWVGDVKQFVTGRAPQNRVRIFNDENKIMALVTWWDGDPDGHMRRFDRISRIFPEFTAIHTQALSQLRSLKSDEAVYVDAIEKLKETIQRRLEEDRGERLSDTLSEFESDYPRVDGIDLLQDDLENYLALARHMEGRDLQSYTRLLQDTEFHTPPFRNKVAERLVENPRLDGIADEYREAVNAWRAGRLDAAIRLLEPLSVGSWGGSARRKLERYNNSLAGFKELSLIQNNSDYPQRLIAYYASLDAGEDVAIQSALADDFNRYKDQALVEAAKSAQQAKAYWQEYNQSSGGIGGALRLEARLSQAFRAQAELLSLAHESVKRSAGVYELLNDDLPTEVASLHRDIVSEVQRQRRALEDLRIVLDSDMVNAKLDLLPQPRESVAGETE